MAAIAEEMAVDRQALSRFNPENLSEGAVLDRLVALRS